MFTTLDAGVEHAPQLRSLVLGVPLAELVAEGEDPFLGPCFFLVPPGTTEGRVEAVVLDRFQKSRSLQTVASGPAARGFGDLARVDLFLHRGHHQSDTGLGHTAVTELDDLGEVVPGVDVHDRKGDRPGPERLLREAKHHKGILASGEEQHGPLELRGHLTHDEDCLGLQDVQLGQLVTPGRLLIRLTHESALEVLTRPTAEGSLFSAPRVRTGTTRVRAVADARQQHTRQFRSTYKDIWQ